MDQREFENALRFALDHLYDPAALRDHPLLDLLLPASTPAASRLQAVRRILIEAIEQLDPGPNVSLASRLRRPYQVLKARYLEDLAVEEIAATMGLSDRQVRREQTAAISLLAERLQPYLQAPDEAAILERDRGVTEAASDIASAVDRLGVQQEPVPLGAVLEDVLGLLEPLRERLGVRVEVQAAQAAPTVLADRNLLRQAILTLISAVVQEAQEPVVMLSLATEGDRALLHLACRADGARITARLAPSRELAMSLEGSLRVQSPGSGLVEVALLLPGDRQCRLLVIDDDPGFAALIGRYVAGQGYTVLAVTDSSEALARAEEWQPEVIALDVMMRNPDGWQLLRLLKGRPSTRHIPIIICSVLPDPALALSLGAQQYLNKPVRQADLLRALAQVRPG